MGKTRFIILVTMIASLTFESLSIASIPRHLFPENPIFEYAKYCSTNELVPVEPVASEDATAANKKFIEKYFPSTLTPTSDPMAVASQFEMGTGQKIVDGFMNSDFVKKSPVGKVNAEFDKISQKSIAISSSKPGGIEHKFTFNVKAVQHTALLDYKGFFDSRLTYNLDGNILSMSVSRPLFKDTTLSLSSNQLINQFGSDGRLTLIHYF